MNLEPLYELKNRLENVAIVGINLVKDDFRLQRAVDQMKGYASAAKVFKQIYEMGQKLIEDDEEDKCDLLLDLLALLDAVLCTQATTYLGDNLQKLETTAGKENFYQELHYSELSQIVSAFTDIGGGRLAIIENAFETNPEIGGGGGREDGTADPAFGRCSLRGHGGSDAEAGGGIPAG